MTLLRKLSSVTRYAVSLWDGDRKCPIVTSYCTRQFAFCSRLYSKAQEPSVKLKETSAEMKFEYPVARRDDTVVDEYHGQKIVDPYRWLENPDSTETSKFVEAQNAITRPFLDSCSVLSEIKSRLTQLWDYEKYSCPFREGQKYYYFKNSGLQNQSVLYVKDSLHGEPRVFLDPNTLSEDGTVALSGLSFSENSETLAYGLSKSGSDWITIHFKDVGTGSDYPDVLQKVKFSSMAWTHDHKGIFYCCYPEAETTEGSETTGNEHQKLYYHKIGTPQTEDVLTVEFPKEPLWHVGAEISECGDCLIVNPSKDCKDNLLFFCNLQKLPGKQITGKLSLTKIVGEFEADYEYVTNEGTQFIFRTNKDAPNYRLIKIDFSNPSSDKWITLVPEHPKHVLDWAHPVDKDKLILCYIKDVKSSLELRDMYSGELLKNFPIDVGTIVGFSGKRKYSEIFYHFQSFLTPGVIYHCNLAESEPEPKVYQEIKLEGFDPSQFETKQVFYTSKDETTIPMFLVHKKDLKLDGNNPCLLYGYGGFNISIQPYFSVTSLVFMQHLEGISAIANIRGGGEYGESWYNAGRVLKKQNVFDDFQCAAEYLISEGYTSNKKLAIQGGSNGGLLVGACINQRPDLFGAAIAQVGVFDMLRFQKFTIGYAWASDYGTSETKEHFDALIKYSPLHNVNIPTRVEVQYPATLLLTADHDDRVVPLHSLKFIATLQHTLRNCQQQTNPILISVETKAGHGGGKPTSKQIEESTDILTFLTRCLDLTFVK